jgi:hypothetical protein
MRKPQVFLSVVWLALCGLTVYSRALAGEDASGAIKDVALPMESSASVAHSTDATVTFSQPAQATGQIRGRVTDPDGAPLAQIDVEAYTKSDGDVWLAVGMVRTDSQGNYTIEGLDAGTYRVGVWFTGELPFGWSPPLGPEPPQPFEYYNNVDTAALATELIITDGANVDHISARLGSPDSSPLARADLILVAQDAMTNTWKSVNSVLDNDIDGEEEQLAAALVEQPAQGALSLHPAGFFTYTLNSSLFISATFTYRANDGVHSSDVATATLIPLDGRIFMPIVSRP